MQHCANILIVDLNQVTMECKNNYKRRLTSLLFQTEKSDPQASQYKLAVERTNSKHMFRFFYLLDNHQYLFFVCHMWPSLSLNKSGFVHTGNLNHFEDFFVFFLFERMCFVVRFIHGIFV